MTTFLWVIFPYICLTIFVGGHIWRYRYDKFGWTTRSSQLYESRLLRIGSPLFHFGMLWVVMGHFLGLVIPKTWTQTVINDEAYHVVAVTGGMLAGAAALSGLVILIYRRRMTGPVFSATTANDKFMYLVLAVVILLGCLNTIQSSGMIAVAGTEHYDYREGVSVWFRSIFWFQPQPELMTGAPWSFQAHSLTAFFLFAIWPFTRLVHVFSAPLGYAVRPYIVYRSRDERPVAAVGSRAPKRGWEQNR
ncbi:respiratory nitrate reductase subunit gamma [Pseudactinotalea sp. Z1739]|uniref:respiratory nitrate reductase subunit gamma n=1 Tax=Pseudactinotalea sp. Z1739 TaxID=3413028 RepID=UPI003C7A7BBD